LRQKIKDPPKRPKLSPPIAFVDEALARAEFSQAVKLIDILVGHQSTPEYHARRRSVYLQAIDHAIRIGSLSGATVLLTTAEKLDYTETDWREGLVIAWMRLDDFERAKRIAASIPDSKILEKAILFQADNAMVDRQRGRDRMPFEHRAAFDAIRTAFANYERNNDEEARTALQAVGLQSPFLEWKLLLRGLIAWSAKDDARAIENWSRLDRQRVPARLIASVRAKIDPVFAAGINRIRTELPGHGSSRDTNPLIAALQQVQMSISHSEGLELAFRKVESIIGLMKSAYPEIASRLADLFYWQIIHHDEPPPTDRYTKVFGTRPDDKSLLRMVAQYGDRIGMGPLASMAWQGYEFEMSLEPLRFTGESGSLARAMVLYAAAQSIISSDYDAIPEAELNAAVRGIQRAMPNCHVDITDAHPLVRKAIELAPDWEVPVAALASRLIEEGLFAESAEVSTRFLLLQPNNIGALTTLSTAQMMIGQLDESIATARRAIAVDPLDRDLRESLGTACLVKARELALKSKFGEADECLREVIAHSPELRACAAAIGTIIAIKQKNQADLERWTGVIPNESKPLLSTYIFAVEAIRLKAGKPVVDSANQRFNEQLTKPATIDDVIPFLQAFNSCRNVKPVYRGAPAHEKAIIAWLARWAAENINPKEPLIELGFSLLEIKNAKLLDIVAKTGRAKYRSENLFQYLAGEAAIMLKPQTFNIRTVSRLFLQVLMRIEDATDDRSHKMRESIERHRGMYPDLDDEMTPYNPFDFFGFA